MQCTIAFLLAITTTHPQPQPAPQPPQELTRPKPPQIPRDLPKPKQPDADDKQPAANPVERGTDKTPWIVQIAPGPDAQEKASEAKKESEQRARADYRAEITTYLIAATSAIQALALIFAIIVMIRSGRRQLRAYVLVSEASFTNFDDNGRYLVNYRNTGQTPAYDVRSDVGLQLADFPLTAPLNDGTTGQKGVSTLGRDGEDHVRLDAPHALTPEEREAIAAGKKAVFVYGSIVYRDIFGKQQSTSYRYYIGGDQPMRANGFMAGYFEGNHAT